MTSDRVKLVKEASDIVEVIGGYITLRPAGSTFKGLCPFHDDHHPSFDVNPRLQRYICWSCGKKGDVLNFVMDHEHVPFTEALTLLARRAGIPLDDSPEKSARSEAKARLFDVLRWAAEQYQQCLLESDLGEAARNYLGQRKLLGPTIRKFGVGYAPLSGDWLVQRATALDLDLTLLEKVGLIAASQHGPGWYDRFRDRVLFPIRDQLGRTLGFGGRILPASPMASRAPKYYNSPETPLFNKSEQVFGLDLARHVAAKEDRIIIVEGYTDVLMAHQCGIENVVATMGTALTARHVHHLRRIAKQVVLTYDADAGGDTGVDRALELFVSQEADLAIATLPAGLDPCDLLSQEGGIDRFRAALDKAIDALEYKLDSIFKTDRTGPEAQSLEGQRRAVDGVLKVIALAPEMPGQAGAMKQQLIVSRMSRRLALKEEILWKRLGELRQAQRRAPEAPPAPAEDGSPDDGPRKARPAPEERQLLQCLLAEPALIPEAKLEIAPDELQHPGLRLMLQGLYDLHKKGETLSLDLLRERLDNPALAEWVIRLHDVGALNTRRDLWLNQLFIVFRQRRQRAERLEIHNQLHAAPDHDAEIELLRQLQSHH